MGKTTIKNKYGESFPKKSRRKSKPKKFFGFRYGNANKFNAKKGKDFINEGYPLELRHVSVIKQKIADDELKELLDLN